MNISANQIVEHIEEKVVLLRQSLANNEEQAVKECATAIEAYCQLLKGMAGDERPKIVNQPKKMIPPGNTIEKESETKFGSLLDF